MEEDHLEDLDNDAMVILKNGSYEKYDVGMWI
jgi:hypothetical protein